jgi:hypothetical protein
VEEVKREDVETINNIKIVDDVKVIKKDVKIIKMEEKIKNDRIRKSVKMMRHRNKQKNHNDEKTLDQFRRNYANSKNLKFVTLKEKK